METATPRRAGFNLQLWRVIDWRALTSVIDLSLVRAQSLAHVSLVGEITLILQRVTRGEADAASELMRCVYGELRVLAAAKMGHELAAHTLQPTALVHEAWLRLGGDAQPDWQNRRHFFGAAAEAMRRILIEQARRRHAERRGGGLEPVQLDEAAVATDGTDEQTLAVNEALEKLAALSPEKAELVKLRYFAGLSLEDTARTLEISEATASRWWTFARAWLIQELAPPKNK